MFANQRKRGKGGDREKGETERERERERMRKAKRKGERRGKKKRRETERKRNRNSIARLFDRFLFFSEKDGRRRRALNILRVILHLRSPPHIITAMFAISFDST